VIFMCVFCTERECSICKKYRFRSFRGMDDHVDNLFTNDLEPNRDFVPYLQLFFCKFEIVLQ
jgi:hypothetical protein